MYIIVNDYPIDVYKIKSISRIHTIRDMYGDVIRAYIKFLKSNSALSIDESYVVKAHKATKREDYRFYNTFIDQVDGMLKTVTGTGLVMEYNTSPAGPAAFSLQYQSMSLNSNPIIARFRRENEINWDSLADIYFFGIKYEVGIFSGGRSSENGVQLFSKFYDYRKDAEDARDLLLSAINTVRCETLKTEI